MLSVQDEPIETSLSLASIIDKYGTYQKDGGVLDRSGEKLPLDVIPIWEGSRYYTDNSNLQMILTPVDTPCTCPGTPYGGSLVFFRTSGGQIQSRLLLWEGDSTTNYSTQQPPLSSNIQFTGRMISISESDSIVGIVRIASNQIQSQIRKSHYFYDLGVLSERPSVTVASQTTINIVRSHIALLISDTEFYEKNKENNFPMIGSQQWAISFQINDEGWGDLTQQEKDLIIIFPFEALKIRANVKIAYSAADEMSPPIPGTTHNRWQTKNDAYRHAYFNAINTKAVGLGVAKLFADAHESEDPPEILLETEMDFWNNDVGRDIADENPDSDIIQLKYLIKNALTSGYLRYLNPIDWIASPPYEMGSGGKNGIINTTQLTPINQ